MGPRPPPPPLQNGAGQPPIEQGFYQNVGGPNGYPMQQQQQRPQVTQPRYSSQTSLQQHSPTPR